MECGGSEGMSVECGGSEGMSVECGGSERMSEVGVRWMEEVREGRAVGSNYQGGWLSLKILGGAVDSEWDTYSG